jgi:hypothetical protein
MGSYLVVGLEEDGVGEARFYDFSNPDHPYQVGGVVQLRSWDGQRTRSAGAAALSKLVSGHYLMVAAQVSMDGDDILGFYVSDSPNSLDSFTLIDEWFESELEEGSVAWNEYQSINIVTQCGGGIYLIGTGNNGPCFQKWCPFPWPADDVCVPKFCTPNGDDSIHVYEVVWDGTEISLDRRAERHMHCAYRDTTYCNFDAAAGVYIDPYRQLYLYSAEHDNKGPDDIIKMMEFRPVPHAPCATFETAWVELFQHKSFGGRSLMIDYADRLLEDYRHHNKVEDFEDEKGTSSAYWCLPNGWSYYLCKHKDPCEACLPLRGTGSPWVIPDLHPSGWGDEISCSGYVYDPPVSNHVTPGGGGRLLYNRPALSGSSGVTTSAEAGTASTEVEVPPGAVTEPVTLSYVPAYPPSHDTSPLVSPGYAFTLTIENGNGLHEGFAFAEPVDVTIMYEDADIAVMDEESFVLSLWDGEAGRWIDAATTCAPASTYDHDLEANSLSVAICRAGEFALVGHRVYGICLPLVLRDVPPPVVTPTPTATGAPTWTPTATPVASATPTPTPTPTATPPAGETLVPAGATWKYLDDGSDQGTAWRDPGFDDSSWATGPAELGYGDGDEATEVSYGPDPEEKHISTYFRHAFTVDDASTYGGLRLRLLRDDGAVVYLNGTEVRRSNMPGGNVDYETTASTCVGGSDEEEFWEVDIGSWHLTSGSNVIAVEVHQCDPGQLRHQLRPGALPLGG